MRNFCLKFRVTVVDNWSDVAGKNDVPATFRSVGVNTNEMAPPVVGRLPLLLEAYGIRDQVASEWLSSSVHSNTETVNNS